ncbi:protein of unknown function [Haladaptatus litoreus]|uniref:DUF4166 domain-containing protein n=1 Tax=Haladaptatus litoreus TaxID=553468 RepID=A0A1N6VAX5_9EURY|nr:protein of unknown function [Haladaptatus litoreus]
MAVTTVTSLFERALGEEWTQLHPEIRERYGLVTDDGRTAIGRGRMTRLSRGAIALPVLWLGTTQNFLFPEGGDDVSFEIRSDAFIDARGYEALTLRRRFETDPVRRFDDTMRWNPERNCITDFFGTDGRIVADIHLSVEDGGLAIRLGDQWIRVGDRYVPFPKPLTADATLQDWYDEYAGRFRVAATVTNPFAGHIFGYQGTFDNDWQKADENRLTNRRLGSIRLPNPSDSSDSPGASR